MSARFPGVLVAMRQMRQRFVTAATHAGSDAALVESGCADYDEATARVAELIGTLREVAGHLAYLSRSERTTEAKYLEQCAHEQITTLIKRAEGGA